MEAFSGKQLQDAKALLEHLQGKGMKSIEQVLSAIEKTSVKPANAQPILCPHCNHPMVYGPPVERLVRLGCKKCGYSKIIGEVK